MIWEFWHYLSTPVAERYIKKMGFLHESIAMAARAKRCHSQWQFHYLECRNIIEQAISKTAFQRKALIIGAGSLQDVPLETLSRQFEKVILMDLVFLNSAKQSASDFKNVELLELDVTQSLSYAFQGDPNVLVPNLFVDDPQVDLVVSLNLITQLPLLPTRWLMHHFKLSEMDADAYGQRLIAEHLAYLKKFKGVKCLIADRLSTEINHQATSDSQQQESIDPWWGVAQPSYVECWQWELIPLGEGKPGFSQTHKVAVSWL